MNLFMNKLLARNEHGLYTLNDEDLDYAYGLNNRLVLTPNEEQIATFAAMNYLFGIFNVTVSSFAAVPAGFLVSYSRYGEFYGTTPTIEAVAITELVKLCNEKIKNEDNAKFYNEMKIAIMEREKPLVEKAITVKKLVLIYRLKEVKENTKNAIEAFKRADNRNCEKNDLNICRVVANGDEDIAKAIYKIDCFAGLFSSTFFETVVRNRARFVVNTTKLNDREDREKCVQEIVTGVFRYHELMQSYVYPGYEKYRGKTMNNKRIEQIPNILNDVERFEELFNLLGCNSSDTEERNRGLKGMVQISSICSTDYSADIVLSVMKKIDELKWVTWKGIGKRTSKVISRTVPSNPENEEQKRKIRNKLHSKYLYIE